MSVIAADGSVATGAAIGSDRGAQAVITNAKSIVKKKNFRNMLFSIYFFVIARSGAPKQSPIELEIASGGQSAPERPRNDM